MGGLKLSPNICDEAVELVPIVSPDLIMQLTLHHYWYIAAIGRRALKQWCQLTASWRGGSDQRRMETNYCMNFPANAVNYKALV
jgi:hypothetical protein